MRIASGTFFVLEHNNFSRLLEKQNKELTDNLLKALDTYTLENFYGELYEIESPSILGVYKGNTITIMGLRKDNLWDKYKNMKEIIKEIKDRFSKVGIELETDYIMQHLGFIYGYVKE